MRAQPSIVSDDNMSWSILTTGPYMDMLYNVSNLPAVSSWPYIDV